MCNEMNWMDNVKFDQADTGIGMWKIPWALESKLIDKLIDGEEETSDEETGDEETSGLEASQWGRHSTPYMNGRATTRGVFKAHAFLNRQIVVIRLLQWCKHP